MPYKVATGHGVALGSLNTIVPQPRADIVVAPVQRNYAVSGAVHEQGLFIDLQWSVLDPVSEYTTLLTAFGLTSVLFANVTVLVPNHAYTDTRYNGIAIRPQQGVEIRRSEYFIRDVTIRVIQLVAL